MGIVTAWTNLVGGVGTAMSYTVIDAPNSAKATTGAIPFLLPADYVTIFIESTGTLGSGATVTLEGSADGSSYVTLVPDVISSNNLSSKVATTIDLGKWSAMKYRLAITTTSDDSDKQITFYLVFRRVI
jgi:hypothetical protein